MKIVEELVKVQKERGLKNSQMAESLGIHTISWYRNKREKVLSADVLLRAFEVYPELRERFLESFPNGSLKTQGKREGTLGRKVVGFLKSWF